MHKDRRTIRGCLFDLDGTVYQDDRVLPGAIECLQRLRQAEIPYLFVTNTTRRPRQSILAQLRDLGVPTREAECLTAPLAAAAWLKSRQVNRILPILEAETLVDLAGFEFDRDQPQCVLVGDLGENWTFQILNQAFHALMNGANLVALQKNRYWRRDAQLTLDAGAFVAALEFAAGKPSREFFHTAASLMKLPPNRVVMVGDDLDSDVLGARQAGLLGIAVRTGKYRSEDEEKAHQVSDAVIDSLADLPDWLFVAG